MSAVSKYVEGLIADTEDLLSSPVDPHESASRMIDLHTNLTATLKSDVVTDEQRERLKAARERLIIEAFKIDLNK